MPLSLIEPRLPIRPLALVTGGTVRIGHAIAMALADAGYDLVLHARREGPGMEAARAGLEQRGAQVHAIYGELADDQAVERLVPACAAHGTLRLLVNNASEFLPDEIGTLDVARWNRHFAVNLRAPVFLTQAFAAQLPESVRGCVINLIDQRVLKPTPHYFSYSLAKQALRAATELLAQSLAPSVRVNAVAPGPTLANVRQTPADFAEQSAAMPLGRGPTPGEIAEAVLYLARAESVTGQMLTVDGGQHLIWRTLDTRAPD